MFLFVMVSCCAVGCNSRSCNSRTGRTEHISFFRLPKDHKLKQLWLTKMKRVDLPKDTRICHLHFTDDSFRRDLKNELLGLPERKFLKEGAVPTLFSHDKQKAATKKRRCSERRKEVSTRRKLVEDAIQNAEEMEKLERERVHIENTKGTQTPTRTQNASTQTEDMFNRNRVAEYSKTTN